MSGQPGRLLRRLSARLFSAHTMERVIDPALADLQVEYTGATSGHPWKRRWILVRGYAAFFKLICLYGASSLRPGSWSFDDRESLKRVVRLASATMIVTTLLFLLRPLSRVTHVGFSPWLFGIATLAYLPLAVAIGVLVGILFGLRNRDVSGTSVIVILAVCLVLAMATRVNNGWILPWANQVRVAASIRPDFPKRSGEIALTELREWIRQEQDFPNSKGFRRNSLTYHERASALPAAPLVLALFGLSVVSRRRNGRVYLMSVAFLSLFGYYLALGAGPSLVRSGSVAPVLGAWLANIVTIAAAAAIVAFIPGRLRTSP